MASRQIRPIRVEGNVAYVPLTRGYEAIIDAADAHLVDKWNWCTCVSLHTVYAVRTEYEGGKRLVAMHRWLMNDPSGKRVDHKDGNGLNNRRSGELGNLRIASHAENMCNRRAVKRGSSGFKGVSWSALARKWRATIKAQRKQHHLGLFDREEDAYAAYVAASARLHGEFGRLT